MTQRRKEENVAIGVAEWRLRKIVCRFDVEVFEHLRLIAIREKTSLAEQIRILVELGIEADEQ